MADAELERDAVRRRLLGWSAACAPLLPGVDHGLYDAWPSARCSTRPLRRVQHDPRDGQHGAIDRDAQRAGAVHDRRQPETASQRVIGPGQGKLHPHQLRPQFTCHYHERRERRAQLLSV